jgi:hypothetical protein
MLSFAEGEVTKLRREFKLVLDQDSVGELCARLSAELGGGMPPPTRIVSVYFDKPGYPLTLRALRTPEDCLKVRTKEYSPDLGAGGVQRVVLEVKREHYGVTQKRRVWVPRTQLQRVLHGSSGLLPLIAGGRLMPVLAVTYRRHVYQATQAWRVTVDRDIGFHPVTPRLALSETTLTAERLGPPLFMDRRVVVEVKHLGEALPPWLAALHPGGRKPAYSKFAEGMARLRAFAADEVIGG